MRSSKEILLIFLSIILAVAGETFIEHYGALRASCRATSSPLPPATSAISATQSTTSIPLISPFTQVSAGYIFKVAGNHPVVNVTLLSGIFSFLIQCVTSSVIYNATVPRQLYIVDLNDGSEIPSGDRDSTLTYQSGPINIPTTVCSLSTASSSTTVGTVSSATFYGNFCYNDTNKDKINIRSHYDLTSSLDGKFGNTDTITPSLCPMNFAEEANIITTRKEKLLTEVFSAPFE